MLASRHPTKVEAEAHTDRATNLDNDEYELDPE
jgi:hypothetical protein